MTYPQNYLSYIPKSVRFSYYDPYEMPISEFEEIMEEWPEVAHGDIVNYLVFGTNTSLTNK